MRTIDEYLELPYRIALVRDQDEDGNTGWVAEVEELPGCLAQGDTAEEAIEHVREAMSGWLSVAIEDGIEIPEPRAGESSSGRLLLRMPGSLHAELARLAEREGVSLNQMLVATLAGAIGWRRPRERVGV